MHAPVTRDVHMPIHVAYRRLYITWHMMHVTCYVLRTSYPTCILEIPCASAYTYTYTDTDKCSFTCTHTEIYTYLHMYIYSHIHTQLSI